MTPFEIVLLFAVAALAVCLVLLTIHTHQLEHRIKGLERQAVAASRDIQALRRDHAALARRLNSAKVSIGSHIGITYSHTHEARIWFPA